MRRDETGVVDTTTRLVYADKKFDVWVLDDSYPALCETTVEFIGTYLGVSELVDNDNLLAVTEVGEIDNGVDMAVLGDMDIGLDCADTMLDAIDLVRYMGLDTAMVGDIGNEFDAVIF